MHYLWLRETPAKTLPFLPQLLPLLGSASDLLVDLSPAKSTLTNRVKVLLTVDSNWPMVFGTTYGAYSCRCP